MPPLCKKRTPWVNVMVRISDDSISEFGMAFDGDALAENTMEVRDLAPSLFAFGELFTRANTILNGEYLSVSLKVRCDDAAAAALAADLPSSASKDYGKTFAEVFKAANMDFYKIDPLLFSPAKVTITNVETGHVFEGGQLNVDLLKQSFSD